VQHRQPNKLLDTIVRVDKLLQIGQFVPYQVFTFWWRVDDFF
jgi:hypothetical protein